LNELAVDLQNRDTGLEEDIRIRLMEVIDPELGVDIVNMGLVYDVRADKNKNAEIDVTLTTPACPLTDSIEDQIVEALSGAVQAFRVNWVFSPPWTLDMITEDGRQALEAIGMRFWD
jgi:metal-sulfur cluster biosynthetic enzyme